MVMGFLVGDLEEIERVKDGFVEENERRVVNGVLGEIDFGIVALVGGRYEDVNVAIGEFLKVL